MAGPARDVHRQAISRFSFGIGRVILASVFPGELVDEREIVIKVKLDDRAAKFEIAERIGRIENR